MRASCLCTYFLISCSHCCSCLDIPTCKNENKKTHEHMWHVMFSMRACLQRCRLSPMCCSESLTSSVSLLLSLSFSLLPLSLCLSVSLCLCWTLLTHATNTFLLHFGAHGIQNHRSSITSKPTAFSYDFVITFSVCPSVYMCVCFFRGRSCTWM